MILGGPFFRELLAAGTVIFAICAAVSTSDSAGGGNTYIRNPGKRAAIWTAGVIHSLRQRVVHRLSCFDSLDHDFSVCHPAYIREPPMARSLERYFDLYCSCVGYDRCRPESCIATGDPYHESGQFLRGISRHHQSSMWSPFYPRTPPSSALCQVFAYAGEMWISTAYPENLKRSPKALFNSSIGHFMLVSFCSFSGRSDFHFLYRFFILISEMRHPEDAMKVRPRTAASRYLDNRRVYRLLGVCRGSRRCYTWCFRS